MGAKRETWKPVPGWEGLYEASTLGRVRRMCATRSPRLLKAWMTYRTTKRVGRQENYPRVELFRPGAERAGNGRFKTIETKRIYLHKLVWETFNGPVPAGMEINHKNFNKRDASLTNLELLTPAQNKEHASQRAVFLLGDANKVKMRQLALTTPRAVLAKRFGCTVQTVRRVCSDIPAIGNKILVGEARDKLRLEMLARTERTASATDAIAARYGVSRVTAYVASRPGKCRKPRSAPVERMAA